MNALILTLFVSTALATLGVLLFAFAVRNKSHDHMDRVSLLPLSDGLVVDSDIAPVPASPSASPDSPFEVAS